MKVSVPDQRKVLHCYDADAQAQIHMEECGELIQAISKMRRAEREELDLRVARVRFLRKLRMF